MSLHDVCMNLNGFSFHDVQDEWKILFLDDQLNPLEEDKLLAIKSKLEQDIRSIVFSDEITYSEEFSLSVEDEYLNTEQESSFPEGVTFEELVEKTLNTILSFAQKESINVLAEIYLFGLHLGIVSHYRIHAASIFGKTTAADAVVFECHDDEDVDEYPLYWDIDFENEAEMFDISECLIDNLRDNFEDVPWECDEDGELTEDGDNMEDKFMTLHKKTFFPNLDDEDDDECDDDECDDIVCDDDDDDDDDEIPELDIEALNYVIPEGLNADSVEGYRNAYLVIIHAFVNDGWKYDPSEYDASNDMHYTLSKTDDDIHYSVSISDSESVKSGSIEIWANLENDHYDEQTQLLIPFYDEDTNEPLPLEEVYDNANSSISDINGWLVEDFIENSGCNEDDDE